MVQTGVVNEDRVVWKRYLAPAFRGQSIGAHLLRDAIAPLREVSDHVLVEHFAGNTKAAKFYKREGWTVVCTEASPSGVQTPRSSGAVSPSTPQDCRPRPRTSLLERTLLPRRVCGPEREIHLGWEIGSQTAVRLASRVYRAAHSLHCHNVSAMKIPVPATAPAVLCA